MAMTAWSAKFFDQLDLLVGEGANFARGQSEHADQFVLLQHWDSQKRPDASKFDGCDIFGSPFCVSLFAAKYRRCELAFLVAIVRPKHYSDWDDIETPCVLSERRRRIMRRQRCKASPSQRWIFPNWASQMRTAFSSMLANTGCRSPGELQIT